MATTSQRKPWTIRLVCLAAVLMVAALVLLVAVPETRRQSALQMLDPIPEPTPVEDSEPSWRDLDYRDRFALETRLPDVVRQRLPHRQQRWFVRLPAAELRGLYASFGERLRHLSHFPELKSLTLSAGTLTPADVDRLANLPRLNPLTLRQIEMDSEVRAALSQLRCSNLTRACLPRLQSLPALRELVLPGELHRAPGVLPGRHGSITLIRTRQENRGPGSQRPGDGLPADTNCQKGLARPDQTG